MVVLDYKSDFYSPLHTTLAVLVLRYGQAGMLCSFVAFSGLRKLAKAICHAKISFGHNFTCKTIAMIQQALGEKIVVVVK